MRILVVDDEPVLRGLAAEALRDAGCQVEEAADGLALLEYFGMGTQVQTWAVLTRAANYAAHKEERARRRAAHYAAQKEEKVRRRAAQKEERAAHYAAQKKERAAHRAKLLTEGKCPSHPDRDVKPGRVNCEECCTRRAKYNIDISVPKRRAQKLLAPSEPVNRRHIFARDKLVCQHCGKLCVAIPGYKGSNKAHMDHTIPLTPYGVHMAWNCQTLCAGCNLAKGKSLEREPRIAHLLHLTPRKMVEAFAKEQGASLPRGWWDARAEPRPNTPSELPARAGTR